MGVHLCAHITNLKEWYFLSGGALVLMWKPRTSPQFSQVLDFLRMPVCRYCLYP